MSSLGSWTGNFVLLQWLWCVYIYIYIYILGPMFIYRRVHRRFYGFNLTGPETPPKMNTYLSCHNFFSLSSVQIFLIPACCLLCVL